MDFRKDSNQPFYVKQEQPTRCTSCFKLLDTQYEVETHSVNSCEFREVPICKMLDLGSDCPFKPPLYDIRDIVAHLRAEHQLQQLAEDSMALNATYRLNVRNKSSSEKIFRYGLIERQLLMVVKVYTEDGMSKVHVMIIGDDYVLKSEDVKVLLEVKFEDQVASSLGGVASTTVGFHHALKVVDFLQEYKTDVGPTSRKIQSINITVCKQDWLQQNAEDFEPVEKKIKTEPSA